MHQNVTAAAFIGLWPAEATWVPISTATPTQTGALEAGLVGGNANLIYRANMASGVIIFGLCFFLGCSAQKGNFSSCYDGDSDCPQCPVGRNESFTSTIL